MMFSNLIFSTIIFLFSIINLAEALENKILFKINNEIVTTIDISNEINYLKATNKQINQLEKNTIIEIAKNSLIKDKIKKIELLKITKKLELEQDYLNLMVENIFSNLGLSNVEEFYSHLNYHGTNIGIIEEKIKIDAYWRQMIYAKYKNKIKVDKNKILKEISNKKIISYELSEILFEEKKKDQLEQKFNIIKKSINLNGFENTALMYGMSDSAKNGGKIGWVNETAISPKILKELLPIEIGEITKPIIVPGGFLILKINNKKEKQIEIDTKKEVDKIANIQINEQLNQFSNLYFNKIRKDIIISEL